MVFQIWFWETDREITGGLAEAVIDIYTIPVYC